MDAATAQAQLGNAAKSFLAGKHQLLIDGKSRDATSGKRFDVVDPATGQAIAAVAQADKADVDEAVKAARRAFESGVEVGRTRLRAYHGTSRNASDLDPLATLRLAAIAFVEQLDIDLDDLMVVSLQPVQLLPDVGPEVVRHLHVAALDDDVHE